MYHKLTISNPLITLFMKKPVQFLIFCVALFSSYSAKTQPYLGIQFLFGTELYTYYRTPNLDFDGKKVIASTPVINPTVGVSGIWAFADNEEVMPYMKLNSTVTYSPFNISHGSERTQGAVNYSFSAGPGVYYASGLFQVQLLYGYQLNNIDLYTLNQGLQASDHWFGVHTFELSWGIGLADWFSACPYIKTGFNRDNAFSMHAGVRIGIGFWN